MFSRDFVGGVATIVIGSVYLYFAYQLRVSALDDSMGPSGLPKVYGWLMMALGAMLTLQAIIVQRAIVAGRAPRPQKGEWEGQGRKIAYAAGLILIGIAYLFIVDTLGYVVSIALLVIVTAAYLGAGLNGRVVAVGVAGAVFLWAMFVALLGVRMPSGILAPLGF